MFLWGDDPTFGRFPVANPKVSLTNHQLTMLFTNPNAPQMTSEELESLGLASKTFDNSCTKPSFPLS